MSTYIVKATPNEDFYVLWSTVVDNAIACGTRAELKRRFIHNPTQIQPDRFTRADALGTSCMWASGYLSWDDEYFLVTNTGGQGTFLLPRKSLRAWCDTRDLRLLKPLPDNEEDLPPGQESSASILARRIATECNEGPEPRNRDD